MTEEPHEADSVGTGLVSISVLVILGFIAAVYLNNFLGGSTTSVSKPKTSVSSSKSAKKAQQTPVLERALRGCDSAHSKGRFRTGCRDAKTAAYEQLGNDAQFVCLDKMWIKESYHWKYDAENQSSGAYGIPQSLPANKMASAGGDWRTNPLTQVRWGLSYIKNKYGTPCKAWEFWQRTDARPHPGHWY